MDLKGIDKSYGVKKRAFDFDVDQINDTPSHLLFDLPFCLRIAVDAKLSYRR